jgi:hypothetical protein
VRYRAAAIAPAAIAIALAETTAATTATTTDDQPPNRGDNGRNRVEPISAKKLMLSLVSVKRITSDKSISSSRATQNVEVLRLDAVAPSQKSDGAVKNLSILHNSPKIYPLLLAQVNTTIKSLSWASGYGF